MWLASLTVPNGAYPDSETTAMRGAKVSSTVRSAAVRTAPERLGTTAAADTCTCGKHGHSCCKTPGVRGMSFALCQGLLKGCWRMPFTCANTYGDCVGPWSS